MTITEGPIRVVSSFSVNMMHQMEMGTQYSLTWREITTEEASELWLVSAIGHESTAEVISERLGKALPMARANVKLSHGERFLIAMIDVTRLPEGRRLTTKEVSQLPIKWLLCTASYLPVGELAVER